MGRGCDRGSDGSAIAQVQVARFREEGRVAGVSRRLTARSVVAVLVLVLVVLVLVLVLRETAGE